MSITTTGMRKSSYTSTTNADDTHSTTPAATVTDRIEHQRIQTTMPVQVQLDALRIYHAHGKPMYIPPASGCGIWKVKDAALMTDEEMRRSQRRYLDVSRVQGRSGRGFDLGMVMQRREEKKAEREEEGRKEGRKQETKKEETRKEGRKVVVRSARVEKPKLTGAQKALRKAMGRR